MMEILATTKLSPKFRSPLTWGTIKGILEEAGLSDTDVVGEIHIVSSDSEVSIQLDDDFNEKSVYSGL